MERDKLIEAKIYSLQMANGQIDMKVGGEEFSHLVNMLYQTFKQNGGKNFFTTSFGFDRDSDHYEMTIQKINGLGMAEKLSAETHRADVAEEALRGLLKKQIEEDCPSIGWKTVIKDCDYKTKSHEDCSKCWTDFITQQAEARLKELMENNND